MSKYYVFNKNTAAMSITHGQTPSVCGFVWDAGDDAEQRHIAAASAHLQINSEHAGDWGCCRTPASSIIKHKNIRTAEHRLNGQVKHHLYKDCAS